MQAFSAGYGRLLDSLAFLAALLLFGMVALITTDVMLRNLAVSGIAGSEELSEYTLYLITMLTAPWLLRRGQHVRMDLLVATVPQGAARMLELLTDCVGLAISVVMVWYGGVIVGESYRAGSLTIKSFVFPEWWLLVPLPVCFLLLAIEFTFRMRRLLAGEVRADARSVG